jgi:hypothetical protein
MKTETDQHTPTPWTVVDHPTLGPIILSDDGPDATDVFQDLRMQDAAFIVRACNNHDALVESLTSLYRFVSYLKELNPDTLWQMVAAKNVLDRIKGETK